MSNPVISNGFSQSNAFMSDRPMSVVGTVNKMFLLLALLSVSFGVVWYQYALGFVDKVAAMTGIGAIGGLVLALIIAFTRKAMNVLVPIYAFAEGMALGGISAVANASLPGIVVQAVVATFTTLFALLMLYKAGVIKCTDKFRGIIIAATFGILLFYLISFVLSLFGVSLAPLQASTPLSIGISVGICVVAALNLILDFDFIENGAIRGYDKSYEWYGAFGLMVTLVWLYVELLELLAKISRR